jgi:hypothetical protein
VRWIQEKGERARLVSDGLGDLIAQPPPPSATTLEALHCWTWCGGWRPEAIPMYSTLHEVQDWPLVLHLLRTIQDTIA